MTEVEAEQDEADRIEAENEASELAGVPHCDCGATTGLSSCKCCGDLCCRDCLRMNCNFEPAELWCWRCMESDEADEDPSELEDDEGWPDFDYGE